MSLVSTNKNLFDTKEDADVTFIIGDKELQAHKLILCSRSSVFKAMITGPMAPATQRHEIRDPRATYDNFSNFLKFLYTDECDIKSDNIEVLLHLSHMYDVSYLFETCVNKLPSLFTAPSPYKYGELGLLYDNKCNMVVKCMKEVPRCSSTASLKYVKQNEYVWISRELVIEFLKHCPRTAEFTEDKIFQKVFDWAKGQCVLQNAEVNSKNLKSLMSKFEPHLKYESMEIKTLATNVYEYQLISQRRLLKRFRDHYVEQQPATKALNSVPRVSIVEPPLQKRRRTRSSVFNVRPVLRSPPPPPCYVEEDDDDWYDDVEDIDELFPRRA